LTLFRRAARAPNAKEKARKLKKQIIASIEESIVSKNQIVEEPMFKQEEFSANMIGLTPLFLWGV
jgi:hypothetical protein